MMDGDFFVPIIRLDLLEHHNLSLPNTWEELAEIATFFHGKDLNDDGEPDFGLCHFPRLGAGFWDQWFAEVVYSTWATYSQTEGIEQGFLFDPETLEPNIDQGFEEAAKIWKSLWNSGSSACDDSFQTGRCAVGYGPPGCWKSTFLGGVSRTGQNGTVLWEPRHKSGAYAEPYRFKPPGSTKVVHPKTGALVPCTSEICPKAEAIPATGHHGINDRAHQFLQPSPHAGKLVNRAPFYWSGGLGGLIRKSSAPVKKDLMWDFFVYTNSPETSVTDVAAYASWLDSWRYSQLAPGTNFIQAGWSRQAYEEHAAMQQWGLSSEANGVLNMRLPGVARYTDEAMGTEIKKFIEDEIDLKVLLRSVFENWEKIHEEKGRLDQRKYRTKDHRTLISPIPHAVCQSFSHDVSCFTRTAVL